MATSIGLNYMIGHRTGGLIVRLESGRPLKPDNMPTKARRIDPNRNPTPMLDFENKSSCFFVNRTFKDIVEELEPNTHQFSPLKFLKKIRKLRIIIG